MIKKCSKCNQEKDTSEFVKDKKKKDGLYSSCRSCNNNRIAHWHKENNEEFSQYQKRWTAKNREKVKNQQKNWRNRQPLNYRIARSLSTRFKIFVREHGLKNSRSKDIENSIGCSIDELCKHLESKFQSGMTWDNYGKNGWEIDHIKPLISFNWEDEESIVVANNYTNLQPLWVKDNRSKSGRCIPDTIEED